MRRKPEDTLVCDGVRQSLSSQQSDGEPQNAAIHAVVEVAELIHLHTLIGKKNQIGKYNLRLIFNLWVQMTFSDCLRHTIPLLSL